MLNITKTTPRQQIKDELQKFGRIIKIRTLPMKNINRMMTYCRFDNSLSVLNAIKASGQLNINNKYPIIKKAFEKINQDQNLIITINTKGKNVHNRMCMCVGCINKKGSTIKATINELEGIINNLNIPNQNNQQKFNCLLRAIEAKVKYRDLLNFFTHERTLNFIKLNKNQI